jgi:hypothetical protein
VADDSPGSTLQQLLDALPDFVERHWPKNTTAEHGGPATPGRGEAMAAVAMFITELDLEHAG